MLHILRELPRNRQQYKLSVTNQRTESFIRFSIFKIKTLTKLDKMSENRFRTGSSRECCCNQSFLFSSVRL